MQAYMESLIPIAIAVLLLIVGYVSLSIMGFFSWSNKFNVEGRTVLLTGASYGMGKEVAKLLAQRGANVILVARNKSKLQSALEYAQAAAKNPSAQRFHLISADLTTEAENARMLADATAWNNGTTPEIIWANAGNSYPGLFLDMKTETLRQQMDTNYWAAAYLAHQALKAWFYPDTPYKPQEKGAKSERSRHFVVTSSVINFVNITGYGGYAPAKSALSSLCDGLRHEVNLYNGARRSKTNPTGQTPAPFDVVIQAVYPATITSPGYEIEQQTKHAVTKKLEEMDPLQNEVQAATAAIKGLEAGNYQTATTWLADLMRLSAMGGAPRDNIVKDTLGSWLTPLIWLFLGPDMESTVWNWGKKEGMPEHKPNSI